MRRLRRRPHPRRNPGGIRGRAERKGSTTRADAVSVAMSETPPDGRPPQGLTTARVTALVDGVFAIVLTLLVLDLHAPTATS
ncbi:MAG: TMEM175 family protein, partial [Candidatus Binataceae bacterium]